MSNTSEIMILVIDDQKDGQARFAPLEQMPKQKCKLEYISLFQKDTLNAVRKILLSKPESKSPDIVLVDHVLDKTSDESQQVLQKGVSVVPLLRERWPQSPMLAVTAAYDDCLNEFGSDIYEEVFDRQNIPTLGTFIPVIVAGYQAAARTSEMYDMLDALKVPEAEREVIQYALPDVCKKEYGTAKYVHELYRWFRHTLYAHAGFLYDKRWVSLTLGVAEQHFEHYQSKLEDYRYSGIWSEPNDPRWWKALLYSSILDRAETPHGKLIQEVAGKVFRIREEHRTKCAVCEKVWPETFAYADENTPADRQEPVHLRCSELHPRITAIPYFEEPRMMLEAG